MIVFSAVVLAGGGSSRMGRDKATILFRGRTLLEHQIATLRSLQPAELFVSARVASNDPPRDVTTVLDEGPDLGPIGGIRATLARCATPLLLVLAVDLPLMTPAFLAQLLAASRPDRGVIASSSGRLEPLAAVYPLAALPGAQKQIAASRLSMQELARALIAQGLLQVHELTPAELPFFANCNRPDELEACRKAADKGGPLR